MHPFAYRLMAGLNRAVMAPNDDSGADAHEFDDIEDDFDEDLDPDAGDEDLDDEQDPDDEVDDEDAPPPPRRESRGESRQAKLARENRELRERQDQLQRDMDALRAPRQPQGETQEQLNSRLAAMDPVERVAELQRLSHQNTQGMIQNLQFQIADTNDQTSFNGLLARNPTIAKHADEVEKRLKQYRGQGVNIPRADVLKHILGEKALESAGRSKSKASRQAEARRAQQQARPSGSRSDGGREGRERDSSKAARDKRLENLKI